MRLPENSRAAFLGLPVASVSYSMDVTQFCMKFINTCTILLLEYNSITFLGRFLMLLLIGAQGLISTSRCCSHLLYFEDIITISGVVFKEHSISSDSRSINNAVQPVCAGQWWTYRCATNDRTNARTGVCYLPK